MSLSIGRWCPGNFGRPFRSRCLETLIPPDLASRVEERPAIARHIHEASQVKRCNLEKDHRRDKCQWEQRDPGEKYRGIATCDQQLCRKSDGGHMPEAIANLYI